MAQNDSQPDGATREAERDDAAHAHVADRLPTGDEEAAADRSAEEFAGDRAQAARHYEEMSDLGAHVKGEGEIDGARRG